MKIINSISELGSFALVGNELFVSSASGHAHYRLSDKDIRYLKNMMKQAEYDNSSGMAVGYTNLFEYKDVPAECEGVDLISLQEVFNLLVCEMLNNSDDAEEISAVWFDQL